MKERKAPATDYPGSSRRRVAREAAILLYTSQEKEYKQAKERAAEILGARMLPSNREVAEEVDAIAEEREGSARHTYLIQLREEALKIMEVLGDFHPRLIGSVWRGTAHRDSDIDISVFSSDPNFVIDQLQKEGFKIAKTEWTPATKRVEKKETFHIYLALPTNDEAEVVVEGLEEIDRYERCEIYGDTVKGLNIIQLRSVLGENPLQRFVPQKGK